VESIIVKDLMVPLDEYATVFEDATLSDAISALEETQAQFDQSKYMHRAILVLEKQTGKVVGKLSQLDVIRSLEPNYDNIGQKDSLSRLNLTRFGFSAQFMESIMKQYNLWDEPLDSICRKAIRKKVKDIMYTPSDGEYVQESYPLNKAIHQLIMGHHQSLIVTRGEEIVGILRLTDVFMKLCASLKSQDASNTKDAQI
jgi:hypothetical protein